MHDPTKLDLAQAARALGGTNRKGGIAAEFPGKVKTADDLLRMLNGLYEEVWQSWEVSEKRAKMIFADCCGDERCHPCDRTRERLTQVEELVYAVPAIR